MATCMMQNVMMMMMKGKHFRTQDDALTVCGFVSVGGLQRVSRELFVECVVCSTSACFGVV